MELVLMYARIARIFPLYLPFHEHKCDSTNGSCDC